MTEDELHEHLLILLNEDVLLPYSVSEVRDRDQRWIRLDFANGTVLAVTVEAYG